MIKLIIGVLLTAVILAGSLYTGILQEVGSSISAMTTDVLPFVPMEFRIVIFTLLLGLVISLGKSFIK